MTSLGELLYDIRVHENGFGLVIIPVTVVCL